MNAEGRRLPQSSLIHNSLQKDLRLQINDFGLMMGGSFQCPKP